MKFYLASVIVLLLTIQFATAQQWEDLGDPNDAYIEIPTLKAFEAIGLSYVQQQIFARSASSTPKFYLKDNVEKLERREASGLTYFRWTMLLKEQFYNINRPSGKSAIRTTFTVSYKPSNQNFNVYGYTYTVYPNGYPNSTYTEDISYGIIDARRLNNGTSPFSSALKKAIDKILDGAVEAGDIPDATYRVSYFYGAHYEQQVIIIEGGPYEEYEGSVPNKRAELWIKIANNQGKYFYMSLEASYPPDAEGEIEFEGEPSYSLGIPSL